jgi:oxygen-independent coproporphyrinogen-3 oxidase
VAWVAEAFDNWSVDLIYGAAGENDDDWDATLAAVLAWGPPHVSAYGLTVEAGTPLASDPSRHPDEDASARRYLAANAALERAGLANYEISNWARRGFECQHNLLYWQQGEYRGIGAAAHSHVDGRRWWNVRTPERYIEAMHAGGPAGRLVAGEETLDADGRAIEALELSLRTAAGVPADALSDVEMLTTLGLIEGRADRVVLTVTGRLLANEVAIRLRV